MINAKYVLVTESISQPSSYNEWHDLHKDFYNDISKMLVHVTRTNNGAYMLHDQ
jgi:hypothetical protein